MPDKNYPLLFWRRAGTMRASHSGKTRPVFGLQGFVFLGKTPARIVACAARRAARLLEKRVDRIGEVFGFRVEE